MPTKLSRMFVRNRPRKGDVAAFGLRLTSALLSDDAWPRALEQACRLARRHRGCDLAVAVTCREQAGGLAVERLAGGSRRIGWDDLASALVARQSPLMLANDEPRWIHRRDDEFQPGATLLRRLDLRWLQMMPFTAAGTRGLVLLAGRDEAVDERHPLIRIARLIWLIGHDRLLQPSQMVAEDVRASSLPWDAAPVALATVTSHEVRRINTAARDLLASNVGRDGQAWEPWLLGAVQRLELAGVARDVVRASQSRQRDLQVILGDVYGSDGERLVALEEASSGPVSSTSDQEATLRALGHELRTPLTAMNTSLELVLRGDAGPLAPDQERFLGATKRNLERLNRLLGDLLEAKRAEAGRVTVNTASIDLGELLQQDLAILEVSARDRGLELRSDVPASFRACVDGDKIQQILHNVVSNAIKYTPRGGFVRVTLGSQDDGMPGLGRRLAQAFGLTVDAFALLVEDSGMGMSEAYLQQLFEPFSRDQRAEADRLPGVGLGLYITRGLVEAHGGEIRLISEPGHGTSVWIVLPREPESARVLTIGRRVAALMDKDAEASLQVLDLRHLLRDVQPWELEASAAYVQRFMNDFGRRRSPAARDGDVSWMLAPGAWLAVVPSADRLGAAWEVATSAPECPTLLAGTGWRAFEFDDSPAALAEAPTDPSKVPAG
jgi:signal transduction histidine kinase